MKTIKKIFPFSFQPMKKFADLLVNVLIQFLIGVIASVLIGILGGMPVVKWIVGILGGLVDLYVVVGIVLSILKYMKVIK